MDSPDFWDFMIEGGDELINTEPCPHCGEEIYYGGNSTMPTEENKK